MPRLPAQLTAALLFGAAGPASAGEPGQPAIQAASSSPAEEPALPDDGFLERLVLDSGRIPFKPTDPSTIGLVVHGEYQLRYQGQTNLALQAPIGQPLVSSLGQSQLLYHWLRVEARFDVFDKLAVVMQIDVPRGLIAGDTTQEVQASRDSLSQAQWYGVYPRYLYLEYPSPIGVFRVGQQGSHWGMGIVANDGDRTSLFGDHRRGSLVERVLYTATPLGKGTPFYVALGGDLVFQDATADLLGGDRAFQVVGAAGYRGKNAEIGVYGAGRHQYRNAQAVDAYTPFIESMTVGTADVAGKLSVPLAGLGGFAYGEIEIAAVFGSTSYIRGAWGAPIDPTGPRADEIRSYGGAATVGVVKVSGEGKERFGRVMGEIEIGYASGDANPNDGVTKRFTFDENHHVGLVLFDHVLRWKTARSATLAQDPALVARAAPGLEYLPSNGGVFGAQYVNPRVVVRPRRWLDLKGGVVFAQSTADVVDPYQFGVLGNARNYDGGDPHAHDLGVELDAGAAARLEVDPGATIQVGAEGGVLVPGGAFDDAAGHKLANQYLGTLQLGLQF